MVAVIPLMIMFSYMLGFMSYWLINTSDIARSMTTSEEDRFVEMYENDALPHTFKHNRIYKHITNNLVYKMRKYEESKYAKTKT